MKIKIELVNKSHRSTPEVRKLVRAGLKGLEIHDITVRVVDAQGRRSWDGKKWSKGRAWGAEGHGVIELWIAPDSEYPFDGWQRHRNSPWNHDHRTWQEALIALTAHEGKHIEIPYSRYDRESAQQIEMVCEAHERWALDRYREGKL
jgi:hypothetical protein